MRNQKTKPVDHTPLIILTVAMALGPLTALSMGSRYADEATVARAQAGVTAMQQRATRANEASDADASYVNVLESAFTGES